MPPGVSRLRYLGGSRIQAGEARDLGYQVDGSPVAALVGGCGYPCGSYRGPQCPTGKHQLVVAPAYQLSGCNLFSERDV